MHGPWLPLTDHEISQSRHYGESDQFTNDQANHQLLGNIDAVIEAWGDGAIESEQARALEQNLRIQAYAIHSGEEQARFEGS